MVFSSVPLYLDPPNWQQQHQNHHHHQQHQQQQQLQGSGTGNDHNNQHLIPPPHQVAQPGHQVAGLGVPPIRPNSMAERARLAKIPPPEAPLKCPRCDSTNTKFCYFNNYSLSQPRHFCKACRRYWTRGGALRNVPVGGGCRRNKRSSSKSSGGGGGSSSKSSLSSPTSAAGVGDRHHMDIMSNTTSMGPTMGGIPGAGGGGGMSFMQSLQNIAHLGMGNLGLTFGGSIHGADHHNPLGGMGGLDFNPNNLLNPPPQPSQVQFPNLLGGFEVPGGTSGGGLYSSGSFQNEQGGGVDGGESGQQVNVNMPKSSSNMMSQLAPVKMEDGQAGLNLAKQFMGISSSTTTSDNGTNSNQFWGATIGNTAGGTNMWTDLSGLNSSSTSHLL